MKEIIIKLKSELKSRYNVTIECSELQGGCIGIKHSEADTIMVRFIVKKLGLKRLTQVEYRNIYNRIVKSNTIAY